MSNEKRPVIIAGARPNFVKVAPLIRAFDAADLPAYLVHTGQHYDEALSLSLFRDLGMRKPDVNFGVGSGNHAAQTARVMTSFDDWVDNHPVSEVIVVGDVNSTVACALVAAKRGIPVAHVEAGLRAFDRTMPEEVNRVVTDALSSWLLTPSADANANLIREGIGEDRIFLVGNIMVDSLENALLRLPERTVVQELGLSVCGYVLVTLHRPAMVDDPIRLEAMLRVLAVLSDRLPVIFPVHPRTRARIDELSLSLPLNLHLVTPMTYLDFVAAQAGARLVVTDSGGVQEETTCLGVTCLTARDNTERPITITEGTNTLVGTDPSVVLGAALGALDRPVVPRRPSLWDGQTAGRIVAALMEHRPDASWFVPT